MFKNLPQFVGVAENLTNKALESHAQLSYLPFSRV